MSKTNLPAATMGAGAADQPMFSGGMNTSQRMPHASSATGAPHSETLDGATGSVAATNGGGQGNRPRRPTAAGVVALSKQTKPSLSQEQVKAALKFTAKEHAR